MIHVLVIVMFMAIVLHDSLFGADASRPTSVAGSAMVWAASFGPMLVLAAATWLVLWVLGQDLRRRGSLRSALLADRMITVSRWAAVALHVGNVLAIGLLTEIRARIGDLVAIDELLTMTLPVGVMLAGWWAYEPIERWLRETTTLRMLDQGRPVSRPPTRGQYVVLNLRHQVLLSLVPLGLIAVWTESLDRVLGWLASFDGEPGAIGRLGAYFAGDGRVGWVSVVLQLAGVAVVFALSPIVLRRVWDTVRLAPGPLRSRLSAICDRSGVGVRDLLVWRTHGTMINGAVVGLVGPLRYILLTDALLEHLPARQVEAVMAHEVGHARHRHMPWLAMSMLVGITGSAAALVLGAWAGLEALDRAGRGALALRLSGSALLEPALAVGSLIVGLGWFGFVSRRFEWQADVFAVQQLSQTPPLPPRGLRTDDPGPTLWDAAPDTPRPAHTPSSSTTRVTAEAVAAMTGALESVAELNQMPRERRSWRHGSIAHRQRRLRVLVDQPLDRLRIDRTVRWLKRGLAAALVLVIAASVWSELG